MKNFFTILCLLLLSNLNAQNINNEHIDSLYHESNEVESLNDSIYNFKIVGSPIDVIYSDDSSRIDINGTLYLGSRINNYDEQKYEIRVDTDTIMYAQKNIFGNYHFKIGYIQTEKKYLSSGVYQVLMFPKQINTVFYNRKWRKIETPKVYHFLLQSRLTRF